MKNVKLRSMKRRSVIAVLSGALVMGFGANAMADTTDDIVNALIAKGVLTEEEGALLMRGRTGEKEAAEEKKKTEIKAKFKDGISFESGDGKHSMALTGRLHFDYRDVEDQNLSGLSGVGNAYSSDSDTASIADNFEVRRARIGVKGKFYEHFDYEVVTNLVGSSANLVDTAWINAGMFKPVQLRLGKFKQPINLEDYGTSSNNIDFMERSYVTQILPGKKAGAMVHGIPTAGLTYAGSIYQQNDFGETDTESDGKGYAGRGTVNFSELAGWKDSVLHVGVSGLSSEYGITPTTSSQTSSAASRTTRGTIFSFRTEGRGLNNIYRAQIAGDRTTTAGYGITSATTAEVDNKAMGLELIGAYGPFKVQGEFLKSRYDAVHENTDNRVEADVQAFYAEALWLITGEKYADFYKNGGWGSIKPNNSFDMESGKGWGAWEIGLRYDEFEVDNTSIEGSDNSRFQGATTNQAAGNLNTNNTLGKDQTKGGAKTYTAGIKWIVNPNVRFMLNYSHTKFDEAFRPIDVTANNGTNADVNTIDSEDIIALRGQVAF